MASTGHFTLDDEDEDIPDIDNASSVDPFAAPYIVEQLAPPPAPAPSPPALASAAAPEISLSDTDEPEEEEQTPALPDSHHAPLAGSPTPVETPAADDAALSAGKAPPEPAPLPATQPPAPKPAVLAAPLEVSRDAAQGSSASPPQAAVQPPSTAPVEAAAAPPVPAASLLGTEPPSTLTQAISKLRASERAIASLELQVQDLHGQHAALLQVGRLLEHQKVLQVLQLPLGFDHDRPVAALLIHRCLLQWLKLSGSEQAPLLEQVAAVLAAQVRRDDDEDDDEAMLMGGGDGGGGGGSTGGERLAYWLSASSVLLAMTTRHAHRPALAARSGGPSSTAAAVAVQQIQQKVSTTIKTWSAGWATFRAKVKDVVVDSGSAGGGAAAATAAAAPSLEGRSSRASALSDDGGGSVSGHSEVGGVSASPRVASSGLPDDGGAAVLAFRQAVDAAVQRTYGGLRDHFKKQVAGLLSACVQVPMTGQRSLSHGGQDFDAGSPLASPSGPPLSPAGRGSSTGGSADPWALLVDVLEEGLALLRRHHVPRILIKCLFKQLFGFINIQLFNQLLLRPECCCSTNARYMSEGLKRVDKWILSGSAVKDEYLVTLITDFKHVRQASSFLCAPNKASLVFEDVVHRCSALNLQQLYRLCTTFYDDDPARVESAPLPPSPPPPPPPLSELPPPPTGSAGDGASPADADAPVPADASGSAEATPAGDAATPGVNAPSTPFADAAAADASTSAAASPTKRSGGGSDVAGKPTPLGLDRRASSTVVVTGGGTVSGEVLEELRRHKEVTGNGGLIVTFLLDEDPAPLIAPQGTVVPEVLQLIDGKNLYQGLAVPALLDCEDCPRSVFAFLEQDVALA